MNVLRLLLVLIMVVVAISVGKSSRAADQSALGSFLSTPGLDDILKLRDPFRKPDLSKYKETAQVKTELQRFPVTDFKLLGVITGPKQLKGMIRDPKGKTHFVQSGEMIGNQNGFISKITPNKLVVEEKVENLLGQKETLVTEITLPAGGGIDVIDSSGTADVDPAVMQQIRPEPKPEDPEAGFFDRLKKQISEDIQKKMSQPKAVPVPNTGSGGTKK